MKIMRDLLDFKPNEMKQFLDSFDTVITDCDGVLWLGTTAIAKSFDTLKKLQSLGKKILFVSNNSAMSLDDYCAKFRKFGYPVNREQIVIPSSVICWYLKKLEFNGKAFVAGTTKFCEVLKTAGIDIVESCTDRLAETYEDIQQECQFNPRVKAVILDLDINLDWLKISRSIQYLKDRDVLYLTGSLDKKIPFGKGKSILGIGPFIDIISKDANRQPTQCAKPSENLKKYVIEKFEIENPSRCLFIGDSFENDMKFATLCGFNKLWVASGVDKLESIMSHQEGSNNDDRHSIPDYHLPSLGHLLSRLDT